jgi:hypothetical protein
MMPLAVPAEQAEQIRLNNWRPIEKYASGGYINFHSDVSDSTINAAYPPTTYARLANVKAEYDPDNVFNQNHNIKPVIKSLA